MIDVESYCRDLEAYLCRKNDGHLIRITGPAFEQVQGWAHQGIPAQGGGGRHRSLLRALLPQGPAAAAGADRVLRSRRARRVRRLAARGRAVVGSPRMRRAGPTSRSRSAAARPRRSLASQIDGALARLTVLRGSDKAGPMHRPGARRRGALARCVAARRRAGARRRPRRAAAAGDRDRRHPGRRGAGRPDARPAAGLREGRGCGAGALSRRA